MPCTGIQWNKNKWKKQLSWNIKLPNHDPTSGPWVWFLTGELTTGCVLTGGQSSLLLQNEAVMLCWTLTSSRSLYLHRRFSSSWHLLGGTASLRWLRAARASRHEEKRRLLPRPWWGEEPRWPLLRDAWQGAQKDPQREDCESFYPGFLFSSFFSLIIISNRGQPLNQLQNTWIIWICCFHWRWCFLTASGWRINNRKIYSWSERNVQYNGCVL